MRVPITCYVSELKVDGKGKVFSSFNLEATCEASR